MPNGTDDNRVFNRRLAQVVLVCWLGYWMLMTIDAMVASEAGWPPAIIKAIGNLSLVIAAVGVLAALTRPTERTVRAAKAAFALIVLKPLAELVLLFAYRGVHTPPEWLMAAVYALVLVAFVVAIVRVHKATDSSGSTPERTPGGSHS